MLTQASWSAHLKSSTHDGVLFPRYKAFNAEATKFHSTAQSVFNGVKHDPFSLLMFYNRATKSIEFAHHFSEIGQTFSTCGGSFEPHRCALFGIQSPAFPGAIDIDSFFELVSLSTVSGDVVANDDATFLASCLKTGVEGPSIQGPGRVSFSQGSTPASSRTSSTTETQPTETQTATSTSTSTSTTDSAAPAESSEPSSAEHGAPSVDPPQGAPPPPSKAQQDFAQFTVQIDLRRAIILPPFLGALSSQSASSKPHDLAFIAHQAIHQHDENHPELCTPSSFSHVVQFLVGAALDADALHSSYCPHASGLVHDWGIKLHRHHFSSSPASSPSSSSSTNDTVDKLLALVGKQISPSKSEPSNPLDRLTMSTQKLILTASSIPGSEMLTKPTPHCAAFCKSNSVGQACAHLQNLLSMQSGLNLQNLNSISSALHAGNFIWHSPLTISGFSFLFCGPMSSLASSTQAQDSLATFLRRAEGKGISEQDVATLIKSKIAIPQSPDELKRHLRNGTGTLSLVFGACAPFIIQLDTWPTHIEAHFDTYQSSQVSNPSFFAQASYGVDVQVQIYWKKCMTTMNHNDLPILDFTTMQSQIEVLDHHRSLPDSISIEC